MFYTMIMQLHYVYLPGLGDGMFNYLRRAMLIGWRLRGLSVSFVDLNWGDLNESSSAKYNRVLEHLTKYSDRQVVLIGESAGGAMALRLFLESNVNINYVYTICGYNNGAEHIDKRHHEAHPAFIPTVNRVDRSLQKIKVGDINPITAYYSPSDEVVDFDRTQIIGAKTVKLPPLSHVGAIGYFLFRTSLRGIR